MDLRISQDLKQLFSGQARPTAEENRNTTNFKNSDGQKTDNPGQMDYSKFILRTKRQYVQISPKKRQELVDLVNQKKCTIKAAAKQLDINYSTAKHIFKQHVQMQNEFDK